MQDTPEPQLVPSQHSINLAPLGEPLEPGALSETWRPISGQDLRHMMEQERFTEWLPESSQKLVPLTLPRKAGNLGLLQLAPLSRLNAACLCVPAALPSGSPCVPKAPVPPQGLEGAPSHPLPRKGSAT